MARDELVHSLSNFKYSICPCRQWIEIKNATRNQENSLSIVLTVLNGDILQILYCNVKTFITSIDLSRVFKAKITNYYKNLSTQSEI